MSAKIGSWVGIDYFWLPTAQSNRAFWCLPDDNKLKCLNFGFQSKSCTPFHCFDVESQQLLMEDKVKAWLVAEVQNISA